MKKLWFGYLVVAVLLNFALGQHGKPQSAQLRAVCDAAAPKLREAGTKRFLLVMTLDDRGRVESFQTDSPKSLKLEKVRNVAAAVKSMRFDPAKKDGVPVAVQIRMTIDCADDLTNAPNQ